MSNLSRQVTAPVSGWTYTWSAAGFEHTVTAFSPTGTGINVPASTNVVSSSGSGSADGVALGTITNSSTAPSSSSTPSATSSSSWGQRAMERKLVVKGANVFILFQMLQGFLMSRDDDTINEVDILLEGCIVF